MQKWQYRVERIDEQGMYVVGHHTEPCDGHHANSNHWCLTDGHEVADWSPITELGANGWELIAIVFENDSEAKGFFKRIIEDQKESNDQ